MRSARSGSRRAQRAVGGQHGPRTLVQMGRIVGLVRIAVGPPGPPLPASRGSRPATPPRPAPARCRRSGHRRPGARHGGSWPGDGRRAAACRTPGARPTGRWSWPRSSGPPAGSRWCARRARRCACSAAAPQRDPGGTGLEGAQLRIGVRGPLGKQGQPPALGQRRPAEREGGVVAAGVGPAAGREGPGCGRPGCCRTSAMANRPSGWSKKVLLAKKRTSRPSAIRSSIGSMRPLVWLATRMVAPSAGTCSRPTTRRWG